MNFDLDATQADVVARAREFATRVLAPRAAARDREERFPVEELQELARLGLLGVNVPRAYGGAEAGAVSYALAMMEIARADASVAVAMAVTNMSAELICAWGNEAQRQRHVPKLVGGPYLCGSFALSEPHAGSDPAAMSTRAVRSERGWRVTGSKLWITSGTHAGLFVVWAKTDLAAGARGISAFLVEKGAPGLSAGKPEDKLGLRGSSTVPLLLDDVAVGEDALLGKLGDGFKIAMTALDGGRIGIASQAVGIATAALASARAVPDADQQTLGDCVTWLEAARLLALRAAWRKSAGLPFSREAAIAKLWASERANKICDRAVSLCGTTGALRETGVERLLRDVRVTRIYEGTSEVQKIVIARQEFSKS